MSTQKHTAASFRSITSARRLWADRWGRWIVVVGGMAVIASILGILIFILGQIFPLMIPAQVKQAGGKAVLDLPAGAMVSDEHQLRGVFLGVDGKIRVFHLKAGTEEDRFPLFPDPGQAPVLTRVLALPGEPGFLAGTHDGCLVALPIKWRTEYSGNQLHSHPSWEAPLRLVMDPERRPLQVFGAGATPDGSITAAAALPDDRLAVVRWDVKINEITGERQVTPSRWDLPCPASLTALTVDQAGRAIFGGTKDGHVIWWQVKDGVPVGPEIHKAGDTAVTALSLLTGDRSLVVGQENGFLSVWFPVRSESGVFRLTRIRDLPALDSSVRLLFPHPRVKGFLAAGAKGELGLYHSTSGRRLWKGQAADPQTEGLCITPKGDGAILTASGGWSLWSIRSPHPEISLGTLFGKVWYEGYDKPAYVWQSSGSTDDFEPKLGLTPLLIGTLKGTFYSLILAIPLGVLGAMYTAHFLHHSLKRFVKPTVEVMAALPSVVLGFLAGLWLAPRMEQVFPALLLMLIVLPLAILGGGWMFRTLPIGIRSRFRPGTEGLVGIGFLVLGMALCLWVEPAFERLVFRGPFQDWLLDVPGLPYDQRNAVVVGLGMGFAVIPIIFSVSEEAFANVPQNLVAGSLALGASRWETVTKIVLPSASPGIFSAIMIGFGRAVGETMIVLMATGNTPIMDWNPFNGFRTLSANIAVEIPEAPQGGTLFRTLFLAGLLLFIFTFVVNTLAELVRQNLRRRFADL